MLKKGTLDTVPDSILQKEAAGEAVQRSTYLLRS
jgi:hypothetical protein